MQRVKNVRRRETVRLCFRHENEEIVDVEEMYGEGLRSEERVCGGA